MFPHLLFSRFPKFLFQVFKGEPAYGYTFVAEVLCSQVRYVPRLCNLVTV